MKLKPIINSLLETDAYKFNMQNIVLDLDFATVSPENYKIHLFYLPL